MGTEERVGPVGARGSLGTEEPMLLVVFWARGDGGATVTHMAKAL